ncbi:AaceriACL095Cp [[Ashbya] aceris (nom. inval.)]|nr:AaceriACL095Cp [[Ashbya] aceris (nom. inval.)]
MSVPDAAPPREEKRHFAPRQTGNPNFDAGLLQQLQRILSNIDLINEGAANDYQPLLQFIQKGFLSQIVQGWSYFAQVNNQNMFGDCTVKLLKTVAVLGSDPAIHDQGSALIRDLLSGHCKVLYRGLSCQRSAVTNPTLKLMRQMVLYNDGEHTELFLNYFDLSVPCIQRILTPNKIELKDPVAARKSAHAAMRANFIKFWVALIKHTPPLLRVDLLTDNYKIMSNWVKYMLKLDTYEVLDMTVECLKEQVLKEKSFKKSSKCKIINESVLKKLVELYHSPHKALVQSVNEFFQLYATDPQYGVVFHDDKLWFDEPVYHAHGNNGAVVTVNQKEFRLYNKLVYTMLTFFKPWEDDLQCSTVLKILRNLPELVPPYCHYIALQGYHEPKMTAYWVGLTLLLGRIINLPIPLMLNDLHTDHLPNTSLVLENVMPASISKLSLTKCLQHDVMLVKHFGCQLLVFSLRKFEKVIQLYTEKGWETAIAILANSYWAMLPDISVIVTALNDVYAKDRSNKIVPLSLTMALRYYSSLFPNYFSVSLPSQNIYEDIMLQESFKGVDLVILDNFMRYQELNSSQIKWWHSDGRKHSLFSSLLRVASSKNSTNVITVKVVRLLDRLLQFTIFINMDKLLGSSTLALVNSLSIISKIESLDGQLEKIWKLLDQTVTRCVKFPYRYVDASKDYGYISPFIVVISEQWKYVEKDTPYDVIAKWMLLFFRSMIILGEPEQGILDLARKLDGIDQSLTERYLDIDRYEEKVSNLSAKEYLLSSNIDFSFSDYITLLPVSAIATTTRYPINDLDAAALLFRIGNILHADSLPLGKYNTAGVLDKLLSLVGNYALSNKAFLEKFKRRQVFESIVLSTASADNTVALEKHIYSTSRLAQIYEQLETDISEFQEYAYDLVVSKHYDWSKIQSEDLLFSLCSVLSVVQLKQLLDNKTVTNTAILAFIISRLYDSRHPISSQQLLMLLNSKDDSIKILVEQLISSNLVDGLDVEAVLSKSVHDPARVSLVQKVVLYPNAVNILVNHLPEVRERQNVIGLASVITDTDNEVILEFLSGAIALSLENLNDLVDDELANAMTLFCNNHHLLSASDKSSILTFGISKGELKYTARLCRFVRMCLPVNNALVKEWLAKSVLFVTKNFAEREHLSEHFVDFLLQFKEVLLINDIWNTVNKASLNSQLEVILNKKWVTDSTVLEYANILLLGGSKNTVESTRLLQIFINNEQQPLNAADSDCYMKYLSAMVIYNLFNKDVSKNSTAAIELQIINFYSGMATPHDRVLLQILEAIESKLCLSWVRNVCSWDFVESTSYETDLGGPVKLLQKEKEGYVITMSKQMIEATLKHYPRLDYNIPEVNGKSAGVAWPLLKNFYERHELSTSNPGVQVYDPFFILLLIINNDELLREQLSESSDSNYSLDVKKLLDCKLLQLVVMSLSDCREIVFNVATVLLNQMLLTLEGKPNFKESNIFRILLTKILYLFVKETNGKKLNRSDVPPVVYYALSRIADLLMQPKASLYEKAYRWVLSSPFIRTTEIPFLHEIIPSNSTAPNDGYYTCLQWILETLEHGVTSERDVWLLKTTNLIEYLFNLQSSPYLNPKLQMLLSGFVFKLQRIESGGSTLISRFGGISQLELRSSNIKHRTLELEDSLSANSKNKKHLKEHMYLRQQHLNCQELGLGYSVIVSAQKRLLEWTEHDNHNIQKRLHR